MIFLRTKVFTSLTILCIFFVILPIPTSECSKDNSDGKTRFPRAIIVDASSDANYTRIQWAIENATHGDTIYVEPGIYNENLIIEKTINLVGVGRHTILHGSGDGDVVSVRADRVNISGFNISNSGSNWSDAGIELDNVQHCRITDTFCSSNMNGIYVKYSSNNTFNNNHISKNQHDGIGLYYSNNNKLNDNWMLTNGQGICFHSSNSNIISHNTFNSNCDGGLDLYNSSNNVIVNNNAITNNGDGINLFIFSSNNAITDNNVSNNNGRGIDISCYSYNNTLVNNTCNSNDRDGVHLYVWCNNSRIINNICNRNGNYGIYVGETRNNIIDGNTCNSNDRSGIYLDLASQNQIINNSCLDNENGISLIDSYRNDVIENLCENNNIGMSFRDVTMCGNCSRNSIVNNSCNSNRQMGIFIDNCNDITMSGNVMNGNGLYLECEYHSSWYAYQIDTTNTVNGRPLYYWTDTVGGRIPSNAGQVILDNCTGVTVENLNVSNATVGIEIGYSSDIHVSNNTCSDNLRGIVLFSSEKNVVSNNICRNNVWDGIYIVCSDYNYIGNNDCSYNNRWGLTIHESKMNHILKNSCSHNGDTGILVGRWDWSISNYNQVYRNTCISNSVHAIFVNVNCRGNLIHSNNFIDPDKTKELARDNGTGNVWAYNGIGNYWSKWTLAENRTFRFNNTNIDVSGTANLTWFLLSQEGIIILYGKNAEFTFQTSGMIYVHLTIVEENGKAEFHEFTIIVTPSEDKYDTEKKDRTRIHVWLGSVGLTILIALIWLFIRKSIKKNMGERNLKE